MKMIHDQAIKNNTNLIAAQQMRVEKLYKVYLDAMELAFDEGNHYVRYTMSKGDKDLNSALRVRSNHIARTAKKYKEFNIESLARVFKVSPIEIRKAARILMCNQAYVA